MRIETSWFAPSAAESQLLGESRVLSQGHEGGQCSGERGGAGQTPEALGRVSRTSASVQKRRDLP